VILGSIPIIVLGLLFQKSIESSLRNLWITAGVLAAFALVLAWADRIGAKRRELGSLRARDAVVLGLAQAAALVPGVSRSGGTISAGLLLGLSRTAAARFSFLLALPAIVGSGFYELAKNKDELTAAGGPGLANTVIAAVVSAVVGYLVIVWFLKLLTTRSFAPFVVYRWVFAVAIVVLIVTNTIPVR
jgi:undecaprenyl-diphosphatase